MFYTNSGSEAVDTALKMVLAYHRARGEAQRTRFISRERGYHGVGFGGMSIGGLPANRKQFANLLGGVDYLPHTHNLEKMRLVAACQNTVRISRMNWNASLPYMMHQPSLR